MTMPFQDIRIPVRDYTQLGRDTLKKMADAGLTGARDELKRRDGIAQSQNNRKVTHYRPKRKTDWGD